MVFAITNLATKVKMALVVYCKTLMELFCKDIVALLVILIFCMLRSYKSKLVNSPFKTSPDTATNPRNIQNINLPDASQYN